MIRPSSKHPLFRPRAEHGRHFIPTRSLGIKDSACSARNKQRGDVGARLPCAHRVLFFFFCQSRVRRTSEKTSLREAEQARANKAASMGDEFCFRDLGAETAATTHNLILRSYSAHQHRIAYPTREPNNYYCSTAELSTHKQNASRTKRTALADIFPRLIFQAAVSRAHRAKFL